MNRRGVFTLTAMAAAFPSIILSTNNTAAQQAEDIERVQAASKAFYAALAALDDRTMEKVWAQTPYVTLVGPRSKSIIVGWDAIKKYWEDTDKLFSERNVSLAQAHIHVNGNLAWEIGQETGEMKLKDGTAGKVDVIATNVYEKQGDGRWLMVSHHVQPKPQ